MPTVPQRIASAAARARIDELQRQLGVQRAEVQDLRERPRRAVEITPDTPHEFATCRAGRGQPAARHPAARGARAVPAEGHPTPVQRALNTSETPVSEEGANLLVNSR